MTKTLKLLGLLVTLGIFLGGCSRSKEEARHLQRAETYFAKGDHAKAEIEYLNVLRLSSTNVTALKRLAIIYFDRGDYIRGIPQIRVLKERGLADAEIKVKLAQALTIGTRLKEAREELAPLLDGHPAHDEALLSYPDTVNNDQDIAAALKLFQSLEPKAGARVPWNLAMATLHMKLRELPKSEPYLKKALQLEPKSGRVHLFWANFYSRSKNSEQAAAYLQKAAELEPLKSPIRLRWIDAKLAMGDEKGAREMLLEITKKEPQHIPPWVYLARIALKNNDVQSGSNFVQKVLTIDNRNLEARLMNAQLKRASGNVKEAVADLEILKKESGHATPVTFELAVAYLQNKNRDRALALLKEIVTKKIDYPKATLLYAELAIESGNAAQVIDVLQDFSQRYPQISQTHFLLAAAYARQQRYADAQDLYNRFQKKHPSNVLASFLSGITYRLQNKPAEARAALERAAANAPDDPFVTHQLVSLDLSEKKYDQALKRIAVLGKEKSRLPVAKYLEGTVYWAQNNPGAAAKALEEAINLDSSFTAAYTMLAQVYLTSGKLKEAVQRLETSLEQNTRNVTTLMLLGAVYERLNDPNKAIEVGSSRVDLQACKLEYSIVSPK